MRATSNKLNAKISIKRIMSASIQILILVLKAISARLSVISKNLAFFKKIKLDFEVLPGDIFIVSYPRSGNTWVQMILYQLATKGDANLQHISQFSTFIEPYLLQGLDITLLQSPRIFKSHMSYSWIPKGPCKYIYVARDGRDVSVSYFHLYRTYHNFKGTFADFFKKFVRGRVGWGSWFNHVSSWWSHKDDSNVLFLWYEDLIDDLEGSIRKVSDFCGFEIEAERFPVIVERCGFSYMKSQEAKFDPFTQLPKRGNTNKNSFIRNGRIDDHEEYMGEIEVQRGGNTKKKDFIRKGIIGDHEEYMSETQQSIFQKTCSKKMSKLGMDFFKLDARGRRTPISS
jgi:hypothetical protein